MSKTRDTGNIGNIVKVDASGNISFVSGSTTLATINTSGQLSGSSPVLSSSYASNAETLDGLDSTQFTLTSSFNAQTASFTAFSSSVNSFSASVLSYTSSLNAKTSSFATTGSNTFIGTQVVSGSVLQSGSFTSTGTLTAQTLVIQTITSSVVYSSGSNIFGNDVANSQTFTGSVSITGSLSLNNVAIPTSASLASTYLQLAGGTLTGALNGTSATFSGNISTATEYRLNNFSFSRVAIYDGGGGFAGGYNFNINGGTPQHDSTGALSAYYYQSGGVISFYTNSSQASGTAAALRMTLNASGNLGLGVTPSAWNLAGLNAMQIKNAAFSGYLNNAYVSANAYFDSDWKYIANDEASLYSQVESQHIWYTSPSGTAGNAITFTQAMTLNASGNLGLGVTPSAWGSILKVNQIGNYGAFIAGRTDSINQIFIGVNAYYNGTSWLYSNTSSASRYYQDNGFHIWDIASSGTAGNAITWTQAMTLFSTGNLAVGTTTDSGYKLDVNGTFRAVSAATFSGGTGAINFTANTSITNTAASGYTAIYGNGGGIYFGGSALNNHLSITSAGAATFSSSVTTGGDLRVPTSSKIFYESGAGTGNSIYRDPANGNSIFTSPVDFRFTNGTATTTYLTLTSSTGAATFSSSVTSTLGSTGANFVSNAATTGSVNAYRVSNTTGAASYGIDSSTGGELITGGLAYATILQSVSNTALQLGTNQTVRLTIAAGGAVTVVGSLSKGSGSFRIKHPLASKKNTHQLVHSFIEGPQADLIYSGGVTLVDGKAIINIDEAATMTEGTFEALNRNIRVFTSNETSWDNVRGKVEGNILTIECQNTESTDEISWLVIGERQDEHIMDTDWTDENGKVIVEPLIPVDIKVESYN